MIQFSKQADERRQAGSMEIWCLHGAVGLAADWRETALKLAEHMISTRALDLWRFLEPGPLSLSGFAHSLNVEAGEETFRGTGRALMGYSMGGRLALHALLEERQPWQASIIISAHPGLEDSSDQAARQTADAQWASRAFGGHWPDFLAEWNAQAILGGAPIRSSEDSGRLISRRREVAQSFLDWSLGQQRPLWDRLGEISIPVLWIAGENDPKFLELARRAASLIPHATLAIAPGAGHRVPWEAEEWLAETVARFVKDAMPH
jgi:2-succinyl-6-hydroxy-2,4-cyclohexadiene-1-carboxylate synthase